MSSRTLRHLSDGLLLMAIALLVVGIVSGSWLVYALAGLDFAAAVGITMLRRTHAKAVRAAAKAAKAQHQP
jgi:uncharacterized membrane protein SirB2